MSLQFIGLERRDVVHLTGFLKHLINKADVDLEKHPKVLRRCGEKRLHRRTTMFNTLMLWLGYYRELRFHNPDLSPLLEEFEMRCGAVARRGHIYPFRDRARAREHLAVVDSTEFDSEVRHDADIVEKALRSAVILAKLAARTELAKGLNAIEPIVFVNLAEREMQMMEENLEKVRHNMFQVKPLKLNLDRHANAPLINEVNKLVYTGRVIINVRRAWEELEKKCLTRIQSLCKQLVKELRTCLGFESNYCRNILKHAVTDGDSSDTLLELLAEDIHIYIDAFPQSANTLYGARSPSLEYDDENLFARARLSKTGPTKASSDWTWTTSPWNRDGGAKGGHQTPFHFDVNNNPFLDKKTREEIEREKKRDREWERKQKALRDAATQGRTADAGRTPMRTRRGSPSLFRESSDDDDDDDIDGRTFAPIRNPSTRPSAPGSAGSGIFSAPKLGSNIAPPYRQTAFDILSPIPTRASDNRLRRDAAWESVTPLTVTRSSDWLTEEDSGSDDYQLRGYAPTGPRPSSSRVSNTLVDLTTPGGNAAQPQQTSYKFETVPLVTPQPSSILMPIRLGTQTPSNPSAAPAPASTPTLGGNSESPLISIDSGTTPPMTEQQAAAIRNNPNRAWAVKVPWLAVNDFAPYAQSTKPTLTPAALSTQPLVPTSVWQPSPNKSSIGSTRLSSATRTPASIINTDSEDSDSEEATSSDASSVKSQRTVPPKRPFTFKTPTMTGPQKSTRTFTPPVIPSTGTQTPVFGARVRTPAPTARAQTVSSSPVSPAPPVKSQAQPMGSRISTAPTMPASFLTPANVPKTPSPLAVPRPATTAVKTPASATSSPLRSPASMLSSAPTSAPSSATSSPVKLTIRPQPSLKPTHAGKAAVGTAPKMTASKRVLPATATTTPVQARKATVTVEPPSNKPASAPATTLPSILKPQTASLLSGTKSLPPPYVTPPGATVITMSPSKTTTTSRLVTFDLQSPGGSPAKTGSAVIAGAKTGKEAVESIISKIKGEQEKERKNEE
ncbi:tegument protein pp150 [Panine betaherpesvirus 2]|uniref:Tegument protein pp150 n=1 Tax=Panine betaherpesvirus 2 TaxID=188763 RepID=Q8QS56_9BETA|nr:tegument protein pp150 [Panine betaherpesvirus 2]AAM00683.1 tegument protein pp150 [Panine betaherpesvirus 2]QXV67786.1 tegument protein pp150 [Panine betaherpesvirus 2]